MVYEVNMNGQKKTCNTAAVFILVQSNNDLTRKLAMQLRQADQFEVHTGGKNLQNLL